MPGPTYRFVPLPTATDGNRLARLEKAIERGEAYLIAEAISEQVAIDLPFGPDRKTLLQIACQKERIKIAQMLLRAGAKPDAKWHEQKTPLAIVLTVDADHAENQTLLLFGMKSGASQHGERTIPRKSKRARLVEALLQHGANPNQRIEGRPALSVAASRGRVHALQSLLAHGAKVDAQDADGKTALHHAIANKDFGVLCVRALLAHGANPDIESAAGTARKLGNEASELFTLEFSQADQRLLEGNTQARQRAGAVRRL